MAKLGQVMQHFPITFGFQQNIAPEAQHQFAVTVKHEFKAGQFIVGESDVDFLSLQSLIVGDHNLIDDIAGWVLARTFLAERKYVVGLTIGARNFIQLTVWNRSIHRVFFQASLSGYYLVPLEDGGPVADRQSVD